MPVVLRAAHEQDDQQERPQASEPFAEICVNRTGASTATTSGSRSMRFPAPARPSWREPQQ